MFCQLFLNLLRALFFLFIIFFICYLLSYLSHWPCFLKKKLFFYLIQIYKKKSRNFQFIGFFDFPADAPKSEGIMLRPEMVIIYENN